MIKNVRFLFFIKIYVLLIIIIIFLSEFYNLTSNWLLTLFN